MAGYQYAHSSPLSIHSTLFSIAPCSIVLPMFGRCERTNIGINAPPTGILFHFFYSLGASHIFMSSCGWPQDYMFYAWCVNVMQSVPGCSTVCRRWIVRALYPIDIRAGYVYYEHVVLGPAAGRHKKCGWPKTTQHGAIENRVWMYWQWRWVCILITSYLRL